VSNLRLQRTHQTRFKTVSDTFHSFFGGAVRAAIDSSFHFDTVPDNATAAMQADRCESLNGALEAIEYVRPTLHGYHHRFIVLISAYFALSHNLPFPCLTGNLTIDPLGKTPPLNERRFCENPVQASTRRVELR